MWIFLDIHKALWVVVCGLWGMGCGVWGMGCGSMWNNITIPDTGRRGVGEVAGKPWSGNHQILHIKAKERMWGQRTQAQD